MKNRIIIVFCTLISISITGQDNNLSDQELDVIKNYQFDIADTEPVFFQLSIPEPSMKMNLKDLKVDLLPLEIEEIAYTIKPIAYKTKENKQYRVIGDIAYGNLNNMDGNVSFRHMVPNYFIYGFDGHFSQINDQSILDRSLSNITGVGMLQYFLKQKTYFDFRLTYNQNQFGVFGFNDENTISSTGENRFIDNREINTALTAHHQFGKKGPALDYQIDVNHLRAIDQDKREVILRNNFSLNQDLDKGFSFDFSVSNDFVTEALGPEATTSLTIGELRGKVIKSNFGIEASGLATFENEEWNIYPNGRVYFKTSDHLIALHHIYNAELITYAKSVENMQFIRRSELSIETKVSRSLGTSYEFANEKGYKFSLSGSYEVLENDAFFINDIEDRQLFDLTYLDYRFYSFGLEYRFPLLANLAFSQSFVYRLLDEEFTRNDLPGFQNYNLISSVDYVWKALTLNLSYALGDQVIYAPIPNYKSESEYEHNLGAHIDFTFLENITAFAKGIDLLDNRFERFAGYQDFGRRYQLGVKLKF